MFTTLRRTAQLALFSTLLMTPHALAGDKAEAAKARQLMELTGSAELGQQMMAQMMTQFQAMGLDEAFVTEFQKRARPEHLVDMVVPIYVENLDEDTMDAAITFYSSKEGKKLVAALPAITEQSMRAGQAWGEKLGAEVAEALKE